MLVNGECSHGVYKDVANKSDVAKKTMVFVTATTVRQSGNVPLPVSRA